jgi:hypothetical protein
MGSSTAEEEKRRTGRTWFDRIWNPLFAVKDVVFTVYVYMYSMCIQYVLRFGFEVLFIMFAKSPPVFLAVMGTRFSH